MDSKEAAYIKSIHANLRKKYKEVGDAAAVWNEHIQNDIQLQKYALSMEMLAEGQWKSRDNTNRIQWCHEVCEEYFLKGGYQRVMEKERRRLNFHRTGQNIAMDQQEKYGNTDIKLDLKEPFTAKWRFQSFDEKLFLLDVGSCYNPFKELSSLFKTVALDLCPSREDVFKADFLELELDSQPDSTTCNRCYSEADRERAYHPSNTVPHCSEGRQVSSYGLQPSAEMQKGPGKCNQCISDTTRPCRLCVLNSLISLSSKKSNEKHSRLGLPSGSEIDRSPSLSCLPSCSFDVVVFSLFLSYFPSPVQRLTSCLTAKKLLRFNGLLLIVESDSAHLNRNSRMIKSWKQCLEKVGFLRYKYEKHRHLHCMAFRKISDEDSYDEVTADLMFIPQDFQDECCMEASEISLSRSELEDQEMVDGFGCLPLADTS